MEKTVYIMRGISGSGKSTIASVLAERNNGIICSTDDYFIVDGEYKFDPSKLAENHQKNFERFKELLEKGEETIIVDNTNLKYWEAKNYIKEAKKHNYRVMVMNIIPPEDPKVLAERNSHGVPLEVIEQMYERFNSESPLSWIGVDFVQTLPQDEVTEIIKQEEFRKKREAKLQEYFKLLEDWWDSDLDIEIGGEKENSNAILIFTLSDSSYWYFGSEEPEWIFDGKRKLSKADLERFPQYAEFMRELEDNDELEKEYTLEEAKELVRKYF